VVGARGYHLVGHLAFPELRHRRSLAAAEEFTAQGIGYDDQFSLDPIEFLVEATGEDGANCFHGQTIPEREEPGLRTLVGR
jgi:hypothetical protein